MDTLIETVAGRFVSGLVKNQRIAKEKENVYRYSAIVTIESAINIVSVLLIGLLFGRFFENVCFFLVFKFLRKFSGGLHASKFTTCYAISMTSNVAVMVILNVMDVFSTYLLALIVEFMALLVAVVFAPVANKNKSISIKEHRVFKAIVSITCILLVISSLLLTKYNVVFVFSICLAMALNSLLILIEKIKIHI